MWIIYLLVGGIILYMIIQYNSISDKDYEKSRKKKDEKNKSESIEVYKKKGVKYFNLKGMHYQNLSKKHIGNFIGYAQNENNEHDQYAVAFYNEHKKLIGYAPKGHWMLYKSIEEWHNGKVFSWGNLLYDDYREKWNCHAYVPIGLSSEQITDIKNCIEKLRKRKVILQKNEISSIEYLEILKDYNYIERIKKELRHDMGFYNYLPTLLITRLSKQLEKEKDWDNIVLLNDYPELIDKLSDTNKKPIQKRIDNAKLIIKNTGSNGQN